MFVLMFALVLVVDASGIVASAAPGQPATATVGQFTVALEDNTLSVTTGKDKAVWQSSKDPLHVAASTMYLQGRDGMFKAKKDGSVCDAIALTFQSLEPTKDASAVEAKAVSQLTGVDCPSQFALETTWTLKPATFSSSSLAITVSINDTRLCSANEDVTSCRFDLQTHTTPDEAAYGFGVQYSAWNMKGRKLPIIVSEQGVGRGLQPLTDLLNLASDHQGGDWHTTYGALPYYITSNVASFFLNHSQYSVFDLTHDTAILSSVCLHQHREERREKREERREKREERREREAEGEVERESVCVRLSKGEGDRESVCVRVTDKSTDARAHRCRHRQIHIQTPSCA